MEKKEKETASCIHWDINTFLIPWYCWLIARWKILPKREKKKDMIVIHLLWEVLNEACYTNDLLNLTTILPLSYIPPSGGIWDLKKMEVNSVQFGHLVSNYLRPHGLQHARLPCPSPTPEACSNSCPLSQWCHPNPGGSRSKIWTLACLTP